MQTRRPVPCPAWREDVSTLDKGYAPAQGTLGRGYAPGKGTLDTGYAWVVLGAAILQHLLSACPMGILGIFLVEIQEFYGCSKTQITLLAMLTFVVGMLLAYPIGKLTQRIGTRWMSIFASLLGFLGYALSAYAGRFELLLLVYGAFTSVSHFTQYVVDIAAVQAWFDVRRGLAIGLLMSSASIGGFLWPPLATFLINYYGWRGAIFIIAALQLHGVVFGLFLKSPVKLKRTPIICSKAEAEKELRNKPPVTIAATVRRFSPFALLLVSLALIQMGFFVYITYLPMRMVELGMDRKKTSLLFCLIGAAGIVIRPLVGVVGDFVWISRVLVYGIFAMLGGSLTIASVAFNTTIPMALYAVGCGVTSAGYMGVQAALSVDLLGRKYNESGTGAMVTSMGIAHAMLHPVSGWLMDTYNDAALPFAIFGVCQLLGGFLSVIVWILHRRIRNTDELKFHVADYSKTLTKHNEDVVVILLSEKS